MPNLVKAARNMIEFIEQNEVIDKYDDDFSESGFKSQGQKLKELKEELNEAIDASTELGNMEAIQKLTREGLLNVMGKTKDMLEKAMQSIQQ